MSDDANEGVLTAGAEEAEASLPPNSMEDRSGEDFEFGEAEFDELLGQSPAAETDGSEADASGDDNETIEEAEELKEPEEDVDSAEEEAEPEEEPEESPKGVQSRIDELTRLHKEATEALTASESRAAALEAKLAERQAEPASSAEDPFSDVEDLAGIGAARERLLKQMHFAMENLDGYTANKGTDQEREYSAAEMRVWHAELTRRLHVDLPQRENLVRQSAEFDALTKAVYPDLYKPGTALHSAFLQAKRQIPGLARLPNAKLVVGDALIGQLVRSGQLKAVPAEAPKPAAAAKATAGKPAKGKKPAGAPVGITRGKPAAPSERQKADQAAAKLERSHGDVEDLADYLSEIGYAS